ncbi:MAG: DHH family phosphoesterase [Bacteriovoracaceae bacterium]|nr:DHH family phosphoesterase [Bacteriovoracaceae bacterium]
MDLTQKFKAKIQSAKRILITTHMMPDADGIGSEIGLCMALKKMGVDAACVNEEGLLERYHYLDPKSIVKPMDAVIKKKTEAFDLCIVVDTNSIERVGNRMYEYLKKYDPKDILFVDHHPAKAALVKEHCIDITAAATGQIVGLMIQALGIKFDKELALPIYTAILIDTSSFRYPTVSGKTHRLIADLLDTGIEAPIAYNGIYGTKKVSHMHLLGTILTSTHSNKSGEIAWITLNNSTLTKFNGDMEDTHAFINHLLVLDNIKVACMFREDGDELKVSLRSGGDIDVGNIARAIGGGGHSHSAATILNIKNKKIDTVISETILKMEDLLKLQK